jgi:putative Mg2+ transporter-C (MgtC) family protein
MAGSRIIDRRFDMDVVTIPATAAALVLRLILAAALGAAVGVNRELRHEPAGLRTHALVALGAALLTVIGLALTGVNGGGDPSATSRILQGIVAGVGFIGGGVILRRDDSKGVHGLSTAASIWIVAATGVAAGCGLWRAAVATVLLVLIILILGAPIDRALRAWRAGDHDGD